MECPKCESGMAPLEFGANISVMRCVGCGGLYCEKQALQRLRDEWMADTVLDTGCAAVGAKNNDIRDIACPGCGTTMERTQDKEQVHIILDTCPDCEGVFLDAGELTDMKNVTLMDQVRRMITIFSK